MTAIRSEQASRHPLTSRKDHPNVWNDLRLAAINERQSLERRTATPSALAIGPARSIRHTSASR